MEDLTSLRSMVRVGEVSSVNKAKRTAQVIFHDFDELVSGDLKILKSPPFIPAKDVPQRTSSEGGGSGEAAFASHTHNVVISPWLPDVGDMVLCLYIPIFNGDGFILGGL